MIYPKINVIGLFGSELNGVQVYHIFLKIYGSYEQFSTLLCNLHINHLLICITGNDDETETGELKEEPRAINFTITNRTEKQKHDVGRKNKGLDLNKEPTSASRLIPGHISYYDENSKGNSLMNECSNTTKIAVGFMFFFVFASYY